MSKKFKHARYLETKGRYVIEIPYCQTSGRPGNRYEWNNAAYAALHYLVGALVLGTTKDGLVNYLTEAADLLNEAVTLASKPHARPLPGKRHSLPE